MDKTRVLNLVKKDFEIFAPSLLAIYLTAYAITLFIPVISLYIVIATNFLITIIFFSGTGVKEEILLCVNFGIKRCEYVIARYITLILLLLLIIPASIYGCFALSHKVATIFILLSILIGFLITGISIPFYFKFKVESVSKIVIPLLFGLMPFGVFLILTAYESKASFLFTTPISIIIFIVILLSIIVLVLSIFISIKIFNKREFS